MQGFCRFPKVIPRSKADAQKVGASVEKGVFMNLKNKPLPKFEVPASFEKYAQGDLYMNEPQTGKRTLEAARTACRRTSRASIAASA
mgnify:CR=1 FL=1